MSQPNGSGESEPLRSQDPRDFGREGARTAAYGPARDITFTPVGLDENIDLRRSELGGQPISGIQGGSSQSYGHGRITGPVAALTSMAERWHLQPSALAILLGLEPYEVQAASGLLTGQARIRGRDQNDRIRYLLEIHGLLHEVFRQPDAAYQWLSEQKQAIGGDSPLGRMLKGSMEDILTVRWLVRSLAGR